MATNRFYGTWEGGLITAELVYDETANPQRYTLCRIVNNAPQACRVELEQSTRVGSGGKMYVFVAPPGATTDFDIPTSVGARLEVLFDTNRGRWDDLAVNITYPWTT